ncbi:MAG: class I SAM-dependent RNA methyltransferase [Anaerolineales bacterium]|nr:class I SAM-dependent RNA methyltransferase [Anaerolineales bacterium]
MSQTVHTVTLQNLTYGGEAMGRLEDGRAVFVAFGLPGERVHIELTEQKRGYARGRLLEVLQKSPLRVEPKCTHHFSPGKPGPDCCGGCHYQQLPYDEQLKAKQAVLADQLQRIGKISSQVVRETVPSPRQWNYRNHVQFHLSDKAQLGYVGTTQEIVPVKECHLPEEVLNELWPQLEFGPGTSVERVSLRLGAEEEILLSLESEQIEIPEVEVKAGISIVHQAGGDTVILAGDDYLLMQAGAGNTMKTFKVSAASFFQVNTVMAGKMVEHLLARLSLPAKIILDVYCGVGLFSAFLAPYCKRLIGIEASPSACEDFVVNLDEFDHVELYEAPAEAVLPGLNLSPDVILVDPPRIGLDRQALDGLLQLSARTVAYISCDPATLARDARRLIDGGYELVEVTPFDLFPQTYHIESIGIFNQ